MIDQLHLQALQALVKALNAVNQTLNSSLKTASVTKSAFSGLPASPTEGMLAGVTDSTTNTWGAVISGGGSDHVLAYYDGVNWTVAAK